jgi:uncharacterized membrane protein
MMNGDMGSMMGWMMGLGLLGWLVVIGLLIAILVVLIRLLARLAPKESGRAADQTTSRSERPR